MSLSLGSQASPHEGRSNRPGVDVLGCQGPRGRVRHLRPGSGVLGMSFCIDSAPMQTSATDLASAVIPEGHRRGCGNGGLGGASSPVSKIWMGETRAEALTHNGPVAGLPEAIS